MDFLDSMAFAYIMMGLLTVAYLCLLWIIIELFKKSTFKIRIN